MAHKTEPFDSSNIGYIIIYQKDQNVYQSYGMNQSGEKWVNIRTAAFNIM